MKKYFFIPIFMMSFLAKGTIHTSYLIHYTSYLKDSLRTEQKGKTIFVVHQVEDGQTLYSLLKKYKCTADAFKTANPSIKGNDLKIGQKVYFPAKAKAKAKSNNTPPISPPVKAKTPKVNDGIEIVDVPEAGEKTVVTETPTKHLVNQGETLYGIAKKYKIPVNDLKKWNNIETNEVKVGRNLWLQEPSFESKWEKNEETPTKNEGSPADELSPKERIEVIEVGTPKPTEETAPVKPTPVPNAPTIPKTVENGLAERIDGGDNSGKYLALHRTAEIGTLIQVKNESNNKAVWVKVIGKLPDIGTNEGVLIKLSPKAFDKLNPSDKRIRAELSYITQ